MSNAQTAATGPVARRRIARRRPVARAWLLGTTAMLIAAAGAGLPTAARAGDTLPTGGSVASGAASIITSGSTLAVNQSTDRAIINWQGFSVGATNAVVFNQPSAASATLNRVTGSAGSEIAGQIRSNGAVYLVNPNGIAITRTGSVQTGGGFIASTLGLSDADFNAGKLAFAGNGSSSAVRNAGSIAAGQGAYVALLGGTVSNSGTISVPLGKIGLGSGEEIGLDLNGNHFMQVAMPTKAISADGALIEASGTITAAGGRVTLSAASVKNAVRNIINLSGSISADSAMGKAGSIELLGGDGGTVTASGTLSARATGATGNGGSVETSGATVNFTGLKVDTSAAHGGTGTWLVDPTDLTVDAAAAATISANLATTSVLLQTFTDQPPSGPGVASPGNGDITIASALTWASTNTLTLAAANNINLNAAITAPIGGLTLTAGFRADLPHAISDTAALSVGTFNITVGNWVQNAATLPSFSATNFSFSPFGASFTRAKGGDGSIANPYLLTDIYGVQGMRSYINNRTADNFALANDIDASGTANWNTGAGFAPIGDNGVFTGNFDGRGHAISGLTINLPIGNVGLFAQDNGNISNLALVGGSITATFTTGALVGYQSGGTISNVSSSATVNGAGNVGGLVGIADGMIVNSRTSGAVNASADNVGGLAGILGNRNHAASISGSSATGNVSDTSGRASDVGGLVGYSTGTIDGSFATGKVTGAAGVDSVGGLVGYLCGPGICSAGSDPIATITNSYATGDVSSGNGNVGGLVGQIYTGNVSGSYAKGKVTDTGSSQSIGGLIGGTRGTNAVTNVYASGDVAGTYGLGGLIGSATGTTISQAQASGNVSATQSSGSNGNAFGGLVGRLDQTSSITQSFATGSVIDVYARNSFGVSVGGLVGYAAGTVTNSNATGMVSGTNDSVGGLIGSLVGDGTYTNNYATGQVIGNTQPDAGDTGGSIGGLIGFVGGNATISKSYATGNVSAVNHTGRVYAGGLIGTIGFNGVTLTQSYSSGNVTVGGAVFTFDGDGFAVNSIANRVGGLIGENDSNGLIDQVYASGSVSSDGQSSLIGGLIGLNRTADGSAIISNAYATGSVTGTGFDPRRNGTVNSRGQSTGGLIGEMYTGTIINTYAVGRVSGANGIGGLVGYIDGCTTCGVSSSYWDTQTTGQPFSRAGTGLITAQLQDLSKYATTYDGWDFGTVWAPPSAGNYPQLYALTPVVYATAGNATTTFGTAPTALGTYKGGPGSYVFGPASDTLAGFLAGSTAATITSNAGQYAVTPFAGANFASSGGVAYRVVADGSGTLTINPAVITVTPIAASLIGTTSKVYDATTLATLVPGNFSLTGFKNGNGATVNQTVGTYANANAGSGIVVTASLSPNNFVANTGTMLSNYTLPTSASGAIGTITPAALTLLYTATAASRAYGSANPVFAGIVSAQGLAGSDTLAGVTSGTASFSTAASGTSNVGSYAITGTGLTGASGNYVVGSMQAAGNANALTVTPRALTLAAGVLTRTYGAANPTTDAALVQSGTSLANGDAVGGVSVTSSATAASNVGSYNLLAGNAQFSSGLASNYQITYVDAPTALKITPAMLSIAYIAAPASSIYGNALPVLTGATSATGLVNGDSVGTVTTGTARFTTAAGSTSNVGSYAITGSGLASASSNYVLTTSQASANATALQITPRGVTVTANAASSSYGAAVPALTYALGTTTANTGLVNGDTLSGALSSGANAAANAGQYAINLGTLGNANYTVSYNGATLTITPAALRVLYTAFATTSIYGSVIPVLSGSTTATGLANGDTLANISSGTATFSTSATSATGVGAYAITGGGLAFASGNYTVSVAQAPGNTTALTITPRTIVITADPQSRSILLNNPSLTYKVGGLGLVNGDKLTGQLSTTAQPLSPTGTYPIALGTVAASANYSVSYVGARLTVNPPPTQSLSDFLAWLRLVLSQLEGRKHACGGGGGSISAALRTEGSASLTGKNCD